jgi:hypothetical protein
LQSTTPAGFAYNGLDGTPRVIPICFQWNRQRDRFCARRWTGTQTTIALTIGMDTWPHRVLQIRGTAQMESVEGVVPEYATAAKDILVKIRDRLGYCKPGSCFLKWLESLSA